MTDIVVLADGGSKPNADGDHIAVHHTKVPHGKDLRCLNGPCQGATVNAPYDAVAGHACAIQWKSLKGPRYAVYLTVDYNGGLGLMYMQSYETPARAEAKVRELTAICAAGVLDDMAARVGD